MRKTVLPALGLSVLAFAATSAFAADLPSRVAPPVFTPPPIPSFTWTGFYVGVNAGAGFGHRQGPYVFSNSGGANTIAGSGGTDGVLALGGSKTAFTGGGQIGYNYQFNPGNSAVAGIEADAQYLGFNSRSTTNYTFTPTTPLTYGAAFVPIPGLASPTIQTRTTDFFGTVRGRLGYAIDRALLYGTGGFAYSEHGIGYAVGGGLEYAISNNISVRGEYLYVNLGSGSGSINAVFDPVANTVTLNEHGERNTFNVVRAALNYKFDVPASAVVARY